MGSPDAPICSRHSGGVQCQLEIVEYSEPARIIVGDSKLSNESFRVVILEPLKKWLNFVDADIRIGALGIITLQRRTPLLWRQNIGEPHIRYFLPDRRCEGSRCSPANLSS